MKILGYTTLALGLALAACTRHRDIAEDVAQQLRSGTTQVDMAHAADFSWDEMFVFGPYYAKDRICRTLKLDGSHCSAASISDVDEGEFLLVFMQRGVVSETVKFPREQSPTLTKVAGARQGVSAEAKRYSPWNANPQFI